MATAFTRSADFALSKPAGSPCPHLRPDFGCSIHGQLAARGFPGCAAYDCFGAGQQVVSVTFGGRDWRSQPGLAGPMFAAFGVMRQLHELLWYLSEACALAGAPGSAARPVHARLVAVMSATADLTRAGPEALAGLDVAPHWAAANALLLRASELARAGSAGPRADLRGADLAGADLRQRDLRGASLRGACLIGARLPGADLTAADLTGADLRGADLRGADLSGALFVTRPAVAAARTDAATRLPPALAGPD